MGQAMLVRRATAAAIALIVGQLLLSSERVGAQSKAILVNDEMAHPPAIEVHPEGLRRRETDVPAGAGSQANAGQGATEQAQPPGLGGGACVTPAGACASGLLLGSPCQCWDPDSNAHAGTVQ